MFYSVKGAIGTRGKAGAVRRRVDDPGILTGNVFLEALRKNGIRVKNDAVVRQAVPPEHPVLHSYASQSLVQLITEVNETSNNMMAETLFLGLGDSESGPVSWPEAQAAVQAFWETRGWRRRITRFLMEAACTMRISSRPPK